MPTTLFSSDKGHITTQAPDRTNPKVMEAATRDRKLGRLPAWIELQKPRLSILGLGFCLERSFKSPRPPSPPPVSTNVGLLIGLRLESPAGL